MASSTYGLMAMVILVALVPVRGHLRLIYPFGRAPTMDFLDTARTSGLCGVQKGSSGPITTLEAGSAVNISWHLAYPHNGGYQLQILDGSTVQHWLTSEGVWTGSDKTTSQSEIVTLPEGFTCEGCTIRIFRQALEWGPNYKFYSCGDVNIITTPQWTTYQSSSDACSGHGNVAAGKCKCERKFSGDVCQFEDDCEEDTDCNSHGRCVDTEGTSFPNRLCFCDTDYYGIYCENENPADFSSVVDLELYQKRKFSSAFTIFHRVIPASQELEVVLRVTGSSWVGLGWKPTGTQKSCQDFPAFDGTFNRTLPADDGVADPEGEAEGTAVPEAEPEGSSEPEAETEPEGSSEPEAETEPEGTSEPEAQPEGEGTGAAAGHPMDCTDIIIGRARGFYSAVSDRYTRDRSTPLLDTYLGGTDSVTAATGYESGGVTVIKFRRLLEATERTDYSIPDADMDVIWAKGQEVGAYIHSPNSGVEAGNGDKMFYHPDELKYHGHSSQRGKGTVNFQAVDTTGDPAAPTVPDVCSFGSSYKHPVGCEGADCEYQATWMYNNATEDIAFTVTAKQLQAKWTGIGFARGKSMENVDVIIGKMDVNGNGDITNHLIEVRYSNPVLKQVQEVKQPEITYADGTYRLSFTRGRRESFSHDCFYFMFPVGGGSISAGGSISRHDTTPVVSSEKVCVEKVCMGLDCVTECTAVEGETKRDTITTRVSIKLQKTYEAAYDDINSAQSIALINTIKPELMEYLVDYVPRVDLRFVALRSGSVIVDMDVLTSAKQGTFDEALLAASVRVAMERTLEDGKVGGVSAVPDFLVVGKEGEAIPSSGQPVDMMSSYVLIGMAMLLLVTAGIVLTAKLSEQRAAAKTAHLYKTPTSSTTQLPLGNLQVDKSIHMQFE